jgi:hypothetical protein
MGRCTSPEEETEKRKKLEETHTASKKVSGREKKGVDRAREMTLKEPQYNGFIYFYITQPFSGKNSLMFAKGAQPMCTKYRY